MFLLREPSDEAVRRYLSSQGDLPFTYRGVGLSRESVTPSGYAVDRYSVGLGEGEAAYWRAVEALRLWRQFDLGWVRLLPLHAPIEVGTTVGVLARHFGFWSLNTARIAYLVEEDGGPVERFGFGYGTLPGHAEKGEERFLVEWDRESNAVRYDVLAFSRPNHPLAYPGYPFARLLQSRFRRDSTRAMVQAVARRA